MKKIHLDQCPSTQNYLLEKVRSREEMDLVSAELQTSGHGRHSNKWAQLKNTVCFSFICPPCEILTLTSLEMSILISEFFHKKYKKKVLLKWPNDLLNEEGQKCGGIIINYTDQKSIVGIGFNLFKDPNDQMPKAEYPIGFISNSAFDFDRKSMCENIYEFINQNRLTPQEIESSWEKLCFHQNKTVEIIDGQNSLKGVFIGIGKNGEALIDQGPGVQKIYNGHLRI